jgi:5-methylcytosine-specific restriction endonuclease McrA
MEYEEQLKTKEWYYVRDRVLERDRHKCTNCGTRRDLQVHHKEYIKGLKAWEYNDSYLVTLCDVCHRIEHGKAVPLDSLEIALRKLVNVCKVKNWLYES